MKFHILLIGCTVFIILSNCCNFIHQPIQYTVDLDSTINLKNNAGTPKKLSTLEDIFEFKVNPILFHDTIEVEQSKNDNDGFKKYYFWLAYYKNSFISVNDIEKILESLSIYQSKIREHVFYLSLLSNSRLREVRNQFNDIQGYNVYYSSSQIIPKDYFQLKKFRDSILVMPNNISLGEFKEKGTQNYIEASLVLIPKVKDTWEAQSLTVRGGKFWEQFNDIPLDSNNPTFFALTPIKISKNDSPSGLNENYFIGLVLKVNSEISFSNETQYKISPLFAPYHLNRIEK